ncbi:2650_t:CDS:1 [Paraglomus occultum]|uniref:2650_t:CDS:1 n=1 Tax=Paraglomus occultum TaxID=144539 RepID=A0A9N9FBA5_9GLOM|nr:2650_t:CDS:1 [Paraglomus occultum]
MVLDALEQQVSKKRGKDVRIADMFDMVAGTSTGSIISLGLTVSDDENPGRPMYRASDLVKFYKEDGKKIFSSIFRWRRVTIKADEPDETEQGPAIDIFNSTYWKNHTKVNEPPNDLEGPLHPSYSPKSLEELLSDKFGDKLLNDIVSNVDVLVPAYNITEKTEAYFTNDDDTNSYKICDVIRASTAAPTYFPAKQIDDNYYVDGGVFINNPAFKAYLEAKKNYPQATKFVVCSLGTGYFQADLENLADSGWLGWLSPLLSLMMNGSSKLTENYLESLVTEQDFHYYRLQSDLPEDIPLDDTRKKALKELEKVANGIINSTDFVNLVEEIVENQELKDQ